eukprot:6486066-Amphidinium_carterae.1
MSAFGAAALEASVEKELAFIQEALGKASSSSVFVLWILLRDSTLDAIIAAATSMVEARWQDPSTVQQFLTPECPSDVES